MTEETSEQELKDRLSLIETMIAEGRRGTESWGWTFVLWGVAYYIATAWSYWRQSGSAWPVTMIGAFILTAIIAARKSTKQPPTTHSRAISAVWICMGISIFIVLLPLGMSGRSDMHIVVAFIGGMLGMANAISSMILKWKLQFASAVVWWGAAVAACFGSENQTLIVFLAAIFICQIVFGIYCMISEAQESKQRGAVHA
jgi:hypothetical protein